MTVEQIEIIGLSSSSVCQYCNEFINKPSHKFLCVYHNFYELNPNINIDKHTIHNILLLYISVRMCNDRYISKADLLKNIAIKNKLFPHSLYKLMYSEIYKQKINIYNQYDVLLIISKLTYIDIYIIISIIHIYEQCHSYADTVIY